MTTILDAIGRSAYLAAVPWNGGISFGGEIAFMFGDLTILPILDIHRKYYGLRMSLFLFATFYAAMVLAALGVEALFGGLGWIPASRNVERAQGRTTGDTGGARPTGDREMRRGAWGITGVESA